MNRPNHIQAHSTSPTTRSFSMCTQECQKRFSDYNKNMAEYEEKWPNYCRECGTKGVIAYYKDSSSCAASLSPSSYYFEEPCSYCWEQGKCPRCGNLFGFNDDGWGHKLPCSYCSWDYGMIVGMPPITPECLCRVDEEIPW